MEVFLLDCWYEQCPQLKELNPSLTGGESDGHGSSQVCSATMAVVVTFKERRNADLLGTRRREIKAWQCGFTIIVPVVSSVDCYRPAQCWPGRCVMQSSGNSRIRIEEHSAHDDHQKENQHVSENKNRLQPFGPYRASCFF